MELCATDVEEAWEPAMRTKEIARSNSDFYAPLPKKIPSLDGLRAISIGMVLVAHLFGTPALREMHLNQESGVLGVRVFFVISGFLITSLLLKEIEKTGTLSLRSFYVRRTLRIFPAFYVYVLSIGGFAWLSLILLRPNDLLS